MKRLRRPTLWVIDETQLSINKGPYPTRKEMAVTSLSDTGRETRRRALLELERRFGDNRTEVLNGSAVVKSPHDLVCMGLVRAVYMHAPSQKGVCTCERCYSQSLCQVWNACV
jgi:hypothetical protein